MFIDINIDILICISIVIFIDNYIDIFIDISIDFFIDTYFDIFILTFWLARREEGEGEGVDLFLKSNNPNLKGGEKSPGSRNFNI